MKIYYLLLEGKPNPSNEESKEVAGAFINCWVKAEDEAVAKDKALRYISAENWEALNVEEAFVANRERYIDEPDSLECFDEAVKHGIGAIFYTWPVDEQEAEI